MFLFSIQTGFYPAFISSFTWEQCMGPEANHLSPFTRAHVAVPLLSLMSLLFSI